jgi:hypothetical protein
MDSPLDGPTFTIEGTDEDGARRRRRGPVADDRRRREEGDGTIDRRRRRLLLGGAAAASAGCLGFGTDDPGDENETGSEAGNEGANETPSEPRITVTDASVDEREVTVEDSIEVTGTLENRSDREGTFHAELRVDGAIVDTEEVTVEAGGTESVTFSGSFAEPGEYDVSVNDAEAGTVVVELPPPEFELVAASVDETTVAPGEAVEVTARITNVGGQEGTFGAELRIDGTTVETRDVTIGVEETASVRFDYAFDEPGTYEVGVGEVNVDTVVVAPPAEFEVAATAIDRTFVNVDEPVEVAARIANVGGQEGTFVAELERDGDVVETRELRIPAGETETTRFSVRFEERGAYELSVSGARVDTLYVAECYVPVEETITVDNRSSHTYSFDLKENVEVTIRSTTRDGVDPTISVDGPSDESLVEGVSDDSVDGSFTTEDAGTHRIRFENESRLPWRDGTWDVEIEVCTW